jgi:hypothetical protein
VLFLENMWTGPSPIPEAVKAKLREPLAREARQRFDRANQLLLDGLRRVPDQRQAFAGV